MIDIIITIVACAIFYLLGYDKGKYEGWQEGINNQYEFQKELENKQKS